LKMIFEMILKMIFINGMISRNDMQRFLQRFL